MESGGRQWALAAVSVARQRPGVVRGGRHRAVTAESGGRHRAVVEESGGRHRTVVAESGGQHREVAAKSDGQRNGPKNGG
jgi:hypothetical protein